MTSQEWRLAPFNPFLYTEMPIMAQPPTAIPPEVRTHQYNRFLDVLPCPRTRVELPSPPGCLAPPEFTYINANYIRGFDGNPQAYIAAMGPLPDTVNAFWRMVWHTKASTIIMATALMERGKSKCERYWPVEFTAGEYGAIKVEWLSGERRPGYQLTRMTVSLGDEVRTLRHFWYNTWPDHGVPLQNGKTYPDYILDMLQDVESEPASTPPAPLLIHCSAGIGRTGAIIAIDYATRVLEFGGSVDVLDTINTIRQDRVSMVQHLTQYELVHQACQVWAGRCCADVIVTPEAVMYPSPALEAIVPAATAPSSSAAGDDDAGDDGDDDGDFDVEAEFGDGLEDGFAAELYPNPVLATAELDGDADCDSDPWLSGENNTVAAVPKRSSARPAFPAMLHDAYEDIVLPLGVVQKRAPSKPALAPPPPPTTPAKYKTEGYDVVILVNDDKAALKAAGPPSGPPPTSPPAPPTPPSTTAPAVASATAAAKFAAAAGAPDEHYSKALWYHGLMARDEAELFLIGLDARGMWGDGAFLVRESPTTPGDFAISMLAEGKVFHNKITVLPTGGVVSIGTTHASLHALVEYHKRTCGGYQHRLTEPVPNPLHLRRLSQVALKPRDLFLMSLPLHAAERAAASKAMVKVNAVELRRAGWLTKQGAGHGATHWKALASPTSSGSIFSRKTWKRRWFVLQDTMIKYYKDETAAADVTGTALGYINLSADTQVRLLSELSFLIITPRRTYSTYGDTAGDVRGWIDMIEKAVLRSQGLL